jgi:hypothetical protein
MPVAKKKSSFAPTVRAKRSREEQAKLLPAEAAPAVQTEESATQTKLNEFEPEIKVIARTKISLRVEQRLVYRPGLGRAWVTVELRLTTALRGLRKIDAYTEAGYLFRLEVLKISPGIKVEGFSLGPWRTERLGMERGNIFVADPLWTGFQAAAGNIRGRIFLVDAKRKCVLDLPWNTEALVPGPEPYAER